MEQVPDTLSLAARKIVRIDFPTAYTKLVVGDIATPGNAEAKPLLDALAPADLLVPGSGKSDSDMKAALSALYLWHDWLTPSHEICQDLHDETGSYWHAIVHRREGDFSNAKYWYARCARHPALATIGANAGQIFHGLAADKPSLRVIMNGYNPSAFVDYVEEVQDTPATDPRHRAAVTLQQLEWRLLFDMCTRR